MTSHETPDVYYGSIEEQYLARTGVELRRSLSRPALAFHDSVFAFMTADGLVVRLGRDATAVAVDADHGSVYQPSGTTRAAGDWLLVPFDSDDPHRWAHYVERAYEHVRAEKLK